MRRILIIIIAAVLGGCAVLNDPVDRLTEKLSATHGLWLNGFNSVVPLPEKATTEKLVDYLFDRASEVRHAKISHTIESIRQVHIEGGEVEHYTAVRVKTNVGEMIVLLAYRGPVLGWWHRIYDAKTMEWWG